MDSGRPFRIARSEGRSTSAPRPAAAKPAAKPDKAPEPEPVPAKKEAAPPPPAPKKQPEPVRAPAKKRRFKPLLTIVVIVVVVIGVVMAWGVFKSGAKVIDESQFQAVTTVDGSIYFGKVSEKSTDYIEIKNAYFLQPSTDAPTSDSDEVPAQTGKLVQLNNKIYSPAGSIVISKQQVLSFELLDPDGQVVQLLGGDS